VRRPSPSSNVFWLLALCTSACNDRGNADPEGENPTQPVTTGSAIAVASHSAAAVTSAGPLPVASAGAVETPEGPRIYSKRRHVWIFYEPNASSGWAGFLGLGSSVRLKSTQSRAGDGCGAFYPVEPRGWVCLNHKTTLDPNEPEYRAIAKFAPKLDSPFPHHYGESRGAPRYTEIPTREQQFKREYQLKEHLEAVEKLRAGTLAEADVPKSLRGVDVKLAGSGPPPELALFPRGIQESRDYLKPLSTVAWSHEFDAEGRTWLVTADLALVPKDKVTPYPRSEFGGVKLDDTMHLPIAFTRYEARRKHKRGADGIVQPTGEMWERMSILPIVDGQPLEAEGKRYYRLKGSDELIETEDATVARLSPETPWGAAVEGAPADAKRDPGAHTVRAPEGGRRSWVEVSVLGGWMVAYENTKPVFATLIAPGRGGIPARGIDPLETASTPVGTFRVDGKFFTSTMANPAFVHSDVPFAQNFHGPHVLHQAYWHDGWGEKRSAGCINLAPKDALWFFHWTEPLIPPGWYGIRSDKQAGPSTVVWVHR
jgi:hypothetical protein